MDKVPASSPLHCRKCSATAPYPAQQIGPSVRRTPVWTIATTTTGVRCNRRVIPGPLLWKPASEKLVELMAVPSSSKLPELHCSVQAIRFVWRRGLMANRSFGEKIEQACSVSRVVYFVLKPSGLPFCPQTLRRRIRRVFLGAWLFSSFFCFFFCADRSFTPGGISFDIVFFVEGFAFTPTTAGKRRRERKKSKEKQGTKGGQIMHVHLQLSRGRRCGLLPYVCMRLCLCVSLALCVYVCACLYVCMP